MTSDPVTIAMCVFYVYVCGGVLLLLRLHHINDNDKGEEDDEDGGDEDNHAAMTGVLLASEKHSGASHSRILSLRFQLPPIL